MQRGGNKSINLENSLDLLFAEVRVVVCLYSNFSRVSGYFFRISGSCEDSRQISGYSEVY
jgi:hypothetical protein